MRKGESPLADQGLSVSFESKLKIDQLTHDYIRDLPSGGAADFRSRVDLIVDHLGAINQFTEINIHRAFCQVNGQLSQLSAQKPTPTMDESERRECQENFSYREHARKFATEGMRVFSVPTCEKPLSANFALNQDIDDFAKRAATASDPEKGILDFVQFLSAKLTDKNQRWNSVNIVTALYQLCELEPNWPGRIYGQAIGEQIISKLSNIADKQVFDGQSVCNLARRVPALIEVVGRMNPKNPNLEKRLFGALSKAVEYTKEQPGEQYADKAFLNPMREIVSRNLSDEGGVALCAYVAKLNHLFSHMAYARNLGTISATFHALNGISSWAQHPDSDAKLTITLRNLNDRLQKTTQSIDSVSAGSIMYGLKGLDVRALSPDAVEQVARTIRIVAEKLNNLPRDFTLNYLAVSSMIKGLTIPLEVHDGPVFRASQQILGAIESRLPWKIGSFDELGCACGALVTLRPHVTHHREFATRLLKDATQAASTPLPFSRSERSASIAWQVTQQAFALYQQPAPEPLQRILDSMAQTVVRSSNPTKSELRVADWASQHPGVTITPQRFQDGFELDILIHPNINIEVDGVFHREPAKVIADKLRDEHLSFKTHPPLHIIRVPSTMPKERFDELLSAALQDRAKA